MTQAGFRLRNSHRPDLPAGKYTLSLEQSGKIEGDDAPRTLVSEHSINFWLGGVDSSLAAKDIVTLYPAENASAAFGHVIPHIVLKNSMLPWMKAMDKADGMTEMPPCLALVLLRPGETSTIEADQAGSDHARIKRLSLGSALWKNIGPSLEELPRLTHIRVVNVEGDGAPMEHAVILSNRLPEAGGMNTLCLVDVSDGALLAATSKESIDLPCLKTWRFRCTEGKNDFHANFEEGELSVAPLRLPAPPEGEERWRTIAAARLAEGRVPLTHHTAQGGDTVSWYRGPLVPGPSKPNLTLPHDTLEREDLGDLPVGGLDRHDTLDHLTRAVEGEPPEFTAWDGLIVISRQVHPKAERQSKSSDAQTYVVCFEPGALARFEDGVYSRLPDFADPWLRANPQGRTKRRIDRHQLERLLETINNTDFFTRRGRLITRSASLIRRDPVSGLDIVDYAVAWEVGRLLGLADERYRKAVLNWRRCCVQSEARADSSESSDHLCCRPPREGTALPDAVENFLAKLARLEGIAFEYLVPVVAMLPVSSLRSFTVDPFWVYRLLQGALSIGRESCPCETAESRVLERLAVLARIDGMGVLLSRPDDAAPALSGFLFRSQAVSTWPDMVPRFRRSTGHTGERGSEHELARVAGTPRKPLPDVMLALTEGAFEQIEITLPEAHPHFEFARRHASAEAGEDPHEQDLRGSYLSTGQQDPDPAGETGPPFLRGAAHFSASRGIHTMAAVVNPDHPVGLEFNPGQVPSQGRGSQNLKPRQGDRHLDESGSVVVTLPEDGFWLALSTAATGVEVAEHYRISRHQVVIELGTA